MAAGPWVLFGIAKDNIVEGTLGPLDHGGTPRYRMILVTSAQDLSAGVNTLDTYSDITAEVAQAGNYVTGGSEFPTLTHSHAAGTITLNAGNVSWASSTITAKWAAIVRDADGNGALAAGDLLLAYCMLDSPGGGNVSTTNGTFAVNNPSGIFTLA
jgi:hypothetical protein